MHAVYHERLTNFKTILRGAGVDGFILSVNDEFFSEYPPEHFKRLEWLTGFSGSAGTVIVTQDAPAFFTDGRYTLQAEQQLKGYTLFNSGETSPLQWLEQNHPSATHGFDPWLVSVAQFRKWQKALPGAVWKPLSPNPLDALWAERPPLSALPAFDYPVSYAGKSREEKLAEIAAATKKAGADALLLTLPESICWLLNLRGRDVAHTPLLLCRALVYADGSYELFVDPAKAPGFPCATLETACAGLSGKKLLLDPATTPQALMPLLEQVTIIEADDPCQLPKACKNPVELANIREVHLIDGAALTKFFFHLSLRERSQSGSDAGEGANEMLAAHVLDHLRAEHPDFLEPSFPTISGFGPNGAIVHYRATPETSRAFAGESLYLVDSGGQYWGGTTDVTRTLAWGTPTAEMKTHYTLVLKGHIALATARFPRGTAGRQLDALARQFLWAVGLDYDHGTGHGVGCFLGVHEGPQGISKLGRDAALAPGMILSNEPGYYRTGQYGIRIENLVVVVESPLPGFLEFETITCAPMDRKLVDATLLTPAEIAWWNDYHAWVEKQLSPRLPPEFREWLVETCAKLRRLSALS